MTPFTGGINSLEQRPATDRRRVLSKLPIGRIVSHQTEPDPARAAERVFGRDLLQGDVLNLDRTKRLFTLFNTHLKSNYVDRREDGRSSGATRLRVSQ